MIAVAVDGAHRWQAAARRAATVFVLASALIFGLALRPVAADTGSPAYLSELQALARQQQLAEDPQWLRLLHMQPRRFGGWQSTIDTSLFFRAANGRNDPAAELDATLAAFFSDERTADEPPQCRYKARYEWLRRRLHFDALRLPLQPCERYEQWARALDVGSIAVVFAANDLDSPSSMFGHTLLRLNAQGDTGRQRLLAYAVNYAAEPQDDSGVAYALKGLSGNYRGYYSVMPYYEKIREYQGYDHRDLWEYPLLLDADARQRLLWHLWELRGIGSDYYFFTRNCSYQLLALIEAARPDVTLTRRFDEGIPYAIPVDTIRALRGAGLLGNAEFQPSAAHELQSMYGQLTPAERGWVVDYVHGGAGLDDARIETLDAQHRARSYEVAHQYLYWRFQQGAVGREGGLVRDHELLVARSAIPDGADFAPLAAPASSPDLGHASGRLSVGAIADAREAAAELRLRPAYHDRLDPAAGYLPGAQIAFLDFGVLARGVGVALMEARLVDIQAVAPRSDTFKPISWQASIGLRRYGVERFTAGAHAALGEYVEGGPGLAWAPLPALQLYAFALTAVEANHDLPKDYALQMGGRTGIAWQPHSRFSTELQADWMGDAAGGGRPLAMFSAQSQLHFGTGDGLRLGLYYGNDREREAGTVHLSWEHYF